MKHRKNLRSIASCVAAGVVLLAMTGCDNDDKVVNEDFEIINPGGSSGEEMVEEVDLPAAIIGNPGDAGGELAKCFTNIVAPENARVILIESGMIAENEELLSAAYSKGNLIVVLNPESGTVEEWSERNNVFYAGPEADEKCAAYGFNNRGAYYSLHNRDLIDDDDVPLFYLCKWINIVAGNRLTGSDLRSKDIKKRFSSQSMTHTFKIKLDEKELVDGHWTSADQLQLTTTANVAYTIYPFFAFDGSAPGEYYAVEAEVTLHNAPLNNGSWVRRRGEELTQICGFYLNRCDLSANLLRKSDGKIAESGSHSFADGANPHPESMSDASSYDSGFAWNLDATLSGGLPDSKDNHKMTMFNNWTWNNSSNISMPGIGIKNGSTANVAYTLMVNGLPGAADDLGVTAIPDPATGEITFKYSWIWRVADITEDCRDKFYMQVGVNPIYQAYQWITGGKATIGEFKNAIPESQSMFRFPLTPPNRVATGSAVLRNSSAESYYISDIKLWRNKTADKEPDVVVPQTIATSTATGGSGVNGTMLMLPAGDYIIRGVRYSMENDQRVNECVIGNTRPITVTVAGNMTIDFGSDLFTVM